MSEEVQDEPNPFPPDNSPAPFFLSARDKDAAIRPTLPPPPLPPRQGASARCAASLPCPCPLSFDTQPTPLPGDPAVLDPLLDPLELHHHPPPPLASLLPPPPPPPVEPSPSPPLPLSAGKRPRASASISNNVLLHHSSSASSPNALPPSCSCSCSSLRAAAHAAAVAAAAAAAEAAEAAAKLRKCCGGNCRCAPGHCRCPQTAVPTAVYACAPTPFASPNSDTMMKNVSAALSLSTTPLPSYYQSPSPLSQLQLQHHQPQQQTFQNVNQRNTCHPHVVSSCCSPHDAQRSLSTSHPPAFSLDLTANHAEYQAHTELPQNQSAPPSSSCCAPPQVSGAVASSSVLEYNPPRVSSQQPPRTMPPRSKSFPGVGPSASESTAPSALHSSLTVLRPLPPPEQQRNTNTPSQKTVCPQTTTIDRQVEPEIQAPSSRPWRRNTENRERPFACHLCDSTFLFKQNRDRHVTEVHLGRRPHKCPVPGCDAAFKNLSGLKQHKKTVHEKARPFKCDQCDGAFGQRNHLRQHILVVHDKVKMFRCFFCDQSFSNVGNRTQHMKRKHPNQAPPPSQARASARGQRTRPQDPVTAAPVTDSVRHYSTEPALSELAAENDSNTDTPSVAIPRPAQDGQSMSAPLLSTTVSLEGKNIEPPHSHPPPPV